MLLLLQVAQKSYFCQDNNSFGELEAKVFCRMLGWPTGKPSQTKIAGSAESFFDSTIVQVQDNLFNTVDCQGDELHILDCDNKIISKVSR